MDVFFELNHSNGKATSFHTYLIEGATDTGQLSNWLSAGSIFSKHFDNRTYISIRNDSREGGESAWLVRCRARPGEDDVRAAAVAAELDCAALQPSPTAAAATPDGHLDSAGPGGGFAGEGWVGGDIVGKSLVTNCDGS